MLSLVCHLIFLAMLFLLLRAEFVAAAQVIVYAGAVMVLYVFVVGYVGGMEAGLAGRSGPTMRVLSVLFAAALFVELAIALFGTGIEAIETEGADVRAAVRRAGRGRRAVPDHYLVAFEVASLLLLIAAVGAVILARRRSGLADVREISVADALRTPLTKGEGARGRHDDRGRGPGPAMSLTGTWSSRR